jgi:outer membrane protein OmpA-like peptidoglycan-associated protein
MSAVLNFAPKLNPRRHALVGYAACALPLVPVLVLVLPGCASKTPSPAATSRPAERGPSSGPSAAPPTTPSAAAPATERSATASPSPLAAERQWLQSWFVGTPVVIAESADGAIRIDVPKEFCFANGNSKILPPLVAVLDKLAQSLRRTPAARLTQVAGPEDKTGTTPLALERANKVRGHLLSRGVGATRLSAASSTPLPTLQLRVEVAPAP